MKIFAIIDMLDKEVIRQDLFSRFDLVDMDYFEYIWPIPPTVKEFQNIILKLERNGPKAYDYPEDVGKIVGDFDPEIIVTHFGPVKSDMIDKAKNLKYIGVMRGGIENVDAEAAKQRGIPIINAPGRNNVAVAEFTVGLILSEIKNIARGHHALKCGKWRRRYSSGDQAVELNGRNIGIIGFGNIGQLVSKIMKQGFGCNIFAYDPFVPKEIVAQAGAKKCTLEEMLPIVDVVTIHARLSPETENLIGKKELQLMKPEAILINSARAGLVNREDLYQALRNRTIAGAALDVFWQEPLAIDDEFIDLDNVTLTPHYAGTTVEAMTKSISILSRRLSDLYK